jgi:N-acetylneuraminate synthase
VVKDPKGCFVIAEAGVNHNGSLDMALRLVDIAADAGADAVKFQTFSTEQVVTANAPKAAYQVEQTGGGNQYAMLKQLELTEEMHHAVMARAAQRGIEFMSTPFDLDSADFLMTLGVRRMKIPSGEITNKPLVDKIAGFGLPLIVSTGMANLEEVAESLSWIEAVHAARGGSGRPDIVVLHCTSNYPADPADANLRAMATMQKAFGYPTGYSDHSVGITIPVAAVALGAVVIEKHFTLDQSLPGPDHKASLSPEELKAMVRGIRIAEAALGDGVKSPKPAELSTRDVARRSVTLLRDLPAGAALAREDLGILRPGTGIAPKDFEKVLGRAVRSALLAGTTLQWDQLA